MFTQISLNFMELFYDQKAPLNDNLESLCDKYI